MEQETGFGNVIDLGQNSKSIKVESLVLENVSNYLRFMLNSNKPLLINLFEKVVILENKLYIQKKELTDSSDLITLKIKKLNNKPGFMEGEVILKKLKIISKEIAKEKNETSPFRDFKELMIYIFENKEFILGVLNHQS